MTIIRSNSISGINSITAQASSLAFYDSTGSSLSLDTGNVSAGVITATTVRVTGDLTVEGTTTTLDTVVTEVDKLEVGANNSTVGVAITQSGTGDILRLYDGASQVVTVADGGNVGIGTDNPTNGTSANARQLVIRNTANPTSRGGLSLIHGTSGTGGFGSIYFGSSNATLRGYIEYAHQTDSMQFGTLAGERLRITSTGNVGIGTDNPSYLLDVKTTDDTTYTAGNFVNKPVARLHNQSSTTDSFASLVFRTGSGDNAIGFVYPGSVNQADFVICNDGGSNGVERFRITSSGNVGIGTTLPAYNLEVFGDSALISGSSAANLILEDRGVADASNPFFLLTSDGGAFKITTADRNASGTTTGSVERFYITSCSDDTNRINVGYIFVTNNTRESSSNSN